MKFSELSEIDQINGLINLLRSIKSDTVKRNNMSEKLGQTDYTQVTARKLGQMNADLDFHSMNLEKQKVMFAKYFNQSCLNVETENREYHPSNFHTFK